MKAVIIGAGSAFGGRLSIDILSRAPLRDSTIALCDTDPVKLEATAAYVRAVIAAHDLPATLQTSTERSEVLQDADVVVLSVSIGGPAYYDEPFDSEIAIPGRYGVAQGVGDTVGPGGLFRALRTAPVMLEMIDDINRICPDAWILNYTNPMAILTWLFSERAQSQVIGLCHGVAHNSGLLARLIDAKREDCAFKAAGINHMTWYLECRHNGEDVREAINTKIIEKGRAARINGDYRGCQNFMFRHEIVEATGYFTTESDRHFPEYVPYFMHEDKLDFLQLFNITKGVKGRRASWFEDMGVKAEHAESVELIRSHESMSGIMEAMYTGEPYRFSANLMNHGEISNLPDGCCIELPATVAGRRIDGERIGELPLICAAMCRSNINFQEMVVQAVRERSRERAYQALMLDPQTQAVLSLKNMRRMFDELWEAEGELLSAYS
jgi:alpha-galactosidase